MRHKEQNPFDRNQRKLHPIYDRMSALRRYFSTVIAMSFDDPATECA